MSREARMLGSAARDFVERMTGTATHPDRLIVLRGVGVLDTTGTHCSHTHMTSCGMPVSIGAHSVALQSWHCAHKLGFFGSAKSRTR